MYVQLGSHLRAVGRETTDVALGRLSAVSHQSGTHFSVVAHATGAYEETLPNLVRYRTQPGHI